MDQNSKPHDYVMTLFEVCETLNKSSRTVSRYIHRNVLHPVGIKSRQGTLEYRFSKAEVDDLKRREEQMRPLNFPGMIDMQQNAASFASISYPSAPVVPQSHFAIPGISYPVSPAPNQTTAPAEPGQSSNESTSQPTVPANNFQEPVATVAAQPGRIEMPEVSARKSDTDNRQIIDLLKETTEMLRGQLRVKDDQIKNLDEKIGQLIERNRETNILLKGLQDKMVLLEKPKNQTATARPEEPLAPSEEAKSAAAPVPNQAPPVRVRVAYSDAVPSIDSGMANESETDQDDDSARWDDQSTRNSRQGKGFFGKMFR